jgi:hypothetical protein
LAVFTLVFVISLASNAFGLDFIGLMAEWQGQLMILPFLLSHLNGNVDIMSLSDFI